MYVSITLPVARLSLCFVKVFVFIVRNKDGQMRQHSTHILNNANAWQIHQCDLVPVPDSSPFRIDSSSHFDGKLGHIESH